MKKIPRHFDKTTSHDILMILSNGGAASYGSLRRSVQAVGNTAGGFRDAFVRLRSRGMIERIGRRRVAWRIDPSAVIQRIWGDGVV